MFRSFFHSESIQKAVCNSISHFDTGKSEKVTKRSPKRPPNGTTNPPKIGTKITSHPQAPTLGPQGRPGSLKCSPRSPKWPPRDPKMKVFGSKTIPSISQWVHESMHQRINESTTQRLNELMTQWINEATTQWNNESITQRINKSISESINRWLNESTSECINDGEPSFIWRYYQRDYQTVAIKWINDPTNRWTNESMKQWINESINQWLDESMNEWLRESTNRWFNESTSKCINECEPSFVCLMVLSKRLPNCSQ